MQGGAVFKDKVQRAQLVEMNKEIARYASRKELENAEYVFNDLVSKGWANVHSYSAIMNVYIRCGDLESCARIFNSMRSETRIKMEVVSCTTMLKGYCGEGNMRSAVVLLNDMATSQPVVAPNIRTLNTVLRGCVITGSIALAESILAKMGLQKDYTVEPDASTWEYVVGLLCQGLHLPKVLPIIGRLKADRGAVPGLGTMLTNIAKAAVILGDWKLTSKMLTLATDSLKQSDEQDKLIDGGGDGNDEDNEAIREMREKSSSQLATGGRQSWKKGTANDSRDLSLKVSCYDRYPGALFPCLV